MARPGTYLYRRKGSANWYLRLVYPPELAAEMGRPRKEFSLRTTSKVEADALAAEHIQKHKIALLAVDRKRAGKPMPKSGEQHLRYPARTMQIIDGVRIIASDTELLFFNDDDGSFLRTEPNTVEVSLANAIEIAMQHPGYFGRYSNGEIVRRVASIKPKSSLENTLTRIVENWIDRKMIGKHIAAEARAVATLFGWMTGYKSLPKCNKSDAIALAKHLEAQGNKSKTVEKKLSHLRAALQIAINDDIFRGANIFAKVMLKVGHDSERRYPLTEADMQRAREHLHELQREDRLLWIWLATTGMRLSEPFQAVEECEDDEGLRYIIVGTKTASSLRRVPIPQAVKPFLPNPIKGPIFPDSPETHAKRLRRFLQKLDIAYDPSRGTGDKRKTIHSLRHRAADRLREGKCPPDIREALLGHELITVAKGYGLGHPVALMLEEQAKIGY